MFKYYEGNLIKNEEGIIKKFEMSFENILNINHEENKHKVYNYTI